MSRAAYFDCPAGAAGDMIMAAFIDAGLPLDYLTDQLARMDFSGYRITAPRVRRQGLAAAAFVVETDGRQHRRTWADIRRLISASGLSEPVKEVASAVFARLAEAEGRVHGRAPEEVHFHEVGAVDSIVDIVGAALAADYFGLEEIWASPLPLGSGFVDTAHGRLPLPAPATLALLERVPTYGGGVEAELITPTGAAVLTCLAGEFGPRPAMTIEQTGLGAGGRDLPDRPNILRLSIGRVDGASSLRSLVQAETNIDDMNPEVAPWVVGRLLDAGALDAWVENIMMKKGRPGWKICFLAEPDRRADLEALLLSETTSLGVRSWPAARRALPRETVSVAVGHGEALVKKVDRFGRVEYIPEYESCRRIAEKTGRPLREIYEEIRKAAE